LRAVPFPVGQIAALGTASCWVLSALAFEAAVHRGGALVVNVLRLAMAAVLLALVCLVVRGMPLPVDASAHAWFWLGISGLVGFTFGDYCLFKALPLVGARLAMLLMACAPVFTVLIGRAVLGEVLVGRDLLGMALTVGGIAWAILDRRPAGAGPRRVSIAGVLFGLGAALGQAGGLVLSKLGMGGYDPFAATHMRVLVGFAGYVMLMTALRGWRRVGEAVGDRALLGYTAIGAFFGPVLGVSLSLIAVQQIFAGVAASLMATTPILILPVAVLVRRERVGLGGLAGTVLAVAGVALLFL
jgi:drug/metabolite transporter (DMT)-like permease